MPGRRARRACRGLLAGLALLVAGGCGEAAPVVQVRVLQMTPLVAAPAPAGGPAATTAVGVAATVAGAPRAPKVVRTAAAPVATRFPIVQVPDVGSIALDATNGGRLVNGLQLPAEGLYWITWDAILGRSPNRPDRRWGTARLISFLVTVLRDFHMAHPTAPPILVGDLSRPFGGPFGSDFGGLGHASHQNGLDADVYYPRADHTLRAPQRPQDVDHALAQDLVSRFVAYGAQFAFVGPHLGLGGPPAVVQQLAHHDDHVHVRIANTTRGVAH